MILSIMNADTKRTASKTTIRPNCPAPDATHKVSGATQTAPCHSTVGRDPNQDVIKRFACDAILGVVLESRSMGHPAEERSLPDEPPAAWLDLIAPALIAKQRFVGITFDLLQRPEPHRWGSHNG